MFGFGKTKELQNKLSLLESELRRQNSETKRLQTLLEFFTYKRKNVVKKDVTEEFDLAVFEDDMFNLPVTPTPTKQTTTSTPTMGEVLISEEYAQKIDTLSNIDFVTKEDLVRLHNELSNLLGEIKPSIEAIPARTLAHLVANISNPK